MTTIFFLMLWQRLYCSPDLCHSLYRHTARLVPGYLAFALAIWLGSSNNIRAEIIYNSSKSGPCKTCSLCFFFFFFFVLTHWLNREESNVIEEERASRCKETLSLNDCMKQSPSLNCYWVKPLKFWHHFLKLSYPYRHKYLQKQR